MPSDAISRVRRLMTLLATVIVLAAGGGAFAYWLSRVLGRLLAARNAEMDGRLQAMTVTFTFILRQVTIQRASKPIRSSTCCMASVTTPADGQR